MWCSPALCFPCAAHGLGGVRALGQMCSVHLPGMPVPRMGNEGIARLGEGRGLELERRCCSREQFGVPGVLDPWAGGTGSISAWRQQLALGAAPGRK